MRVAIVGGGLATCYHLLAIDRNLKIQLFEKDGIGAGASGSAAGLLHPYTGSLAQLNWCAQPGIAATIQLLDAAAQAIGKATYKISGIVRCAIHPEDQQAFFNIVRTQDDVSLWDPQHTYSQTGVYRPALFIPNGLSVYTDLYLKGIWHLCDHYGAELVLQNFTLSDSAYFDKVILACGANLAELYPALNLVLKRGEVLICEKRLTYALIGDGYLSLTDQSNICYMGTTSRTDLTDLTLDEATKLIRSQVDPWFKSDIQVLGYKSGIRVYRSLVSAHPIIDQLDNKTWCFPGLGSRGLMYHAYLGSILAKAILQQSPKLIPQVCKITR
ncbi:MAG: FAD-binding oxidoreductase [Candidatus Cardinium sp.]|uniref:FAD-dependent oxidoreductase n=1 Tax=Cardinium endosymbiont of Dermatophagoides farinae TaxID=2597823 RepID=UPI0011844C81|nr:FAD-dependent oxidoreductase [Cardinium endosymbiont of Dermatophagoides farinae]TSJ80878.1 FAD-binding oxidoreductase [Cardinium endosymbiont of Dermatophagoides farinae]UWW96889.1 MAG: FAD-binding oxidoreductase [Candidatus Cardinium sp.]